MPPDHISHEHQTDHGDIVVDRGSGTAVILGILLVLTVLAAVRWFAQGPGMAGTGTDVNINIHPPAVPSLPADS